ncbi:hypothetical protein [Haloarchaeobius sp. DYHT-AS-18]|uniref:hypothetical protein n=1 Tax=Haloarchaeobius sp. DYHT-AS-18 TaxID=3446117 RepID=UPI003EBC2993
MSNPTLEVTGRARTQIDAEPCRLTIENTADADRPADHEAGIVEVEVTVDATCTIALTVPSSRRSESR